MNTPLQRIISGGQTGADMAALKAANHYGYETGGTISPGSKSEIVKHKYNLEELQIKNKGNPFVQRSIRNVINSDATLAFRIRSSSGTDKTVGFCLTGKWKLSPFSSGINVGKFRPVLILSSCVDIDDKNRGKDWEKNKELLLQFLGEYKVQTLNVCGHRLTMQDPTWEYRVHKFLLYALKK